MSGEQERENRELSSVSEGDQIAVYLEALRQRLGRGMARVTPGQADQILAETEDHLREATALCVAAGLTEQAAQAAAVEAFGQPQAVARSHRPLAGAVLARLATALVPLAGTYLLVSGAGGSLLAQWHWHGGLASGRQQTLWDLAPTWGGFHADLRLIGCAVAGAVSLPGFIFPLAAVAMVLIAAADVSRAFNGWGGGSDLWFSVGTILGAQVMALGCAAWSVVRLARSAVRSLRLAS